MTYKIAQELDLEERWHIFAKRTEATEAKFKPKLIDLFGKQERSVLSRMSRVPVPQLEKLSLAQWGRWMIEKVVSEEAEAAAESYVAEIFIATAWETRFRTAALPFVREAFQEAGQAAFAEVGVEASFSVTNPRARKILQDRVFKFAKEVNETTQARLRTALAQGFDAGEGIPQLSQRVADVFDIAKSSRTDMIARTEIVGASNQGTFQGLVDSDVVETIIWIETKDTRTRPAHTAHSGVGGEEVKLGERFSNGLKYPHDPSGPAEEVINCRCSSGSGKLKEAA